MLPTLLRRTMASEVKKVPIPRRGVDYRGKIVLAPMVRSGELPSRLLALRYGADLVWGPETVDYSIIGATRRVNHETKTIEWTRISSHGQKVPPPDARESVIYMIHPENEAGKLIFQIGTANPERAVEAARLVAADVSGIDVNAGCPKPFSTSGGMGAALLQTPEKLCSILRALVENITPEFNIGISVKIRILDTAAQTEALVRSLCATGITGLTVHCRTTPMRPRERAIRGQLRMVADICRENGVACLMNGDVEGKEQGLKLAEEFGADGAMIATSAEKNPSCFRTESEGGMLPWKEVVEEYVKTSLSVGNRWGNTKYLLSQMVPGKARHEHEICCRAKTYVDLCKGLGYDNLLESAHDADLQLELAKPKPSAKSKAKKNPSALAAGGKLEKPKSAKKSLSERRIGNKTEAQTEKVALAG